VISELYRFSMKDRVWTYTSGGVAVTHAGETYLPRPIGRGHAEAKNDMSRASLEVRLDITDELSRAFLDQFFDFILEVTIFRKDEVETVVEWKGVLAGVLPSLTHMTFNFESALTSLRRPGLQQRFQKNCRHILYRRGCNLNREDFAVTGPVTAINGALVTMPAAALQPNGYYTGGVFTAGWGVSAYITYHEGSGLVLQRSMDELLQAFANDEKGWGKNYGRLYGGPGASISPGCDRTINTCRDRFNNLDNNGAFPFITDRNPFDGSSII
jgi:hypothetical protein